MKTQHNSLKTTYKQALKVLLPYGMLVTKKWLVEKGLTLHAIDNAVKTDTLLLLSSGVYCQYSRSISWQGVVASMQYMNMRNESKLPPEIVGGLSALAISGLSQYVLLSSNSHVHLYAKDKLPTWLARLSLPSTFERHSTRMLWPDELLQNRAFIKEHVWQHELPPVYFSCPEKAIFEVLLNVPETVSFEHADELMQGLVNLSPRKLSTLLTACKNVKVKRLFFWFAKRQNYQWFKTLDVSCYDLGSGKRVVAKGGKLDRDYLITVPAHMMVSNE